jgi:hypothetical protein
MYEEITPQFVRECTDALEFFDENNCLPWQKRKVTVTISEASIIKLKGKNKSQEIEKSLNYIN